MIKKLRILGLFFSLTFLFSFQNCAPFESSFQGLSSVGFFQGYEPKVSNNPFTCNPGVEPEAHALRRLTKKEYENSIRDLFRGALSESDIQSAIRQIPTEETSVDFKNFNSSPGLSHIEGYFSAAEDIAEKVTTSDSVLAQFMGSNCVTLSSALSAQCLSQITETFFKRAFRRPLSQAELDKLVAIYNEADNHLLGIQSLIQYSLNSPSFVYRLELDGPSLDGREDLYLLDGYGVASRLSYLLTKSMPDDELFAAADGDELRTKEQILAQAERIISNSPQFKGAIRDFFSQWLKISDQEMNYSSLFSKNINANASLRQAAEEELHQFVEKTLFEGQGTFAQLMNSRKAYYSHSELAKIYGVAGRGSQAVELPEGRSGLLTRAAFLMTGLDNTRPMHRGASFQRNILCASLQQPPPLS